MADKKAKKRRLPYLLDIIIPIYGEWDLAERALAAAIPQVEALNIKARFIVVDNGSGPVQRPPLAPGMPLRTLTPKEAAAPIRGMLRPTDAFTRLEQNQGFPGAVNYGVSRGTAPYVMILSADILLHDGAIGVLLKEMDNEDVGIVGMKLLFPPDTKNGPQGMIQHAGQAIDISGQIIHIFIGWHPDHPKVNQRCEVSSVTGGVFMTRRSIWNDIGGMNTAYGSGTYEDVEYCIGVRLKCGKKVIYTPNASAYHYVGGSISHGQNKQGFALYQNAQIFMARNLNHLEWDDYKRR
jgi:GT2 family glycosyltransferase